MYKPSGILEIKDAEGLTVAVCFDYKGNLQLADSHDVLSVAKGSVQELVGFLMTEHLQEEEKESG